MVCKKKVNGDKKSNELLLIFRLNEKSSNVHDKLMKWLFKCLDTISDKVFDGYNYNWNIISQIQDNDWEDDDDHKIKNTIKIAIHITNDNIWLDDLTISYNYNQSITLSPQDIMDCLKNEPIFIEGIGVSSVSSEIMMDFWKEMISTETGDVPGKGYMIHPMWRKYKDLEPHFAKGEKEWEWGEWSSVREMSFNFGWKGYTHD